MEKMKDFIMLDLNVSKKDELLKLMGNHLYEKGFVSDNFVTSVIEREEKFPTGLPTAPYAVAIPHTDTDEVLKPAIVFANLQHEVNFKMMGDMDTEVEVKVVIMLALDNPEKQLGTLKKLTALLQDQEKVSKLGNTKNEDECAELIDIF